MSERIVVIGSCNTDMVINTERLPQPGETIIGGNFFMNAGGKGANQAVAAARLGGRVSFMAKVGNDHFGSRSIEQYKSEGIEVEHILVDNDNPSGVALIMVDAKGENCIAVASGANALLRPEDIDKATDTIERGDIVLMQLETPLETVEYASRIAREKGKKVILNDWMTWESHSDFCGAVSYETEIDIKEFSKAFISFKEVHEMLELIINGTHLPHLMLPPFEADISEYLKKGHNKIVASVTNSTAMRFSSSRPVSGIIGEVLLKTY